ncbi:MAG TPA: hypothetical protein VJC16_01930 [Candidatus Nanoarchaeia archaeon]|nr:hypothetical protein [Candidatus Nanoarchaeia archaeon]
MNRRTSAASSCATAGAKGMATWYTFSTPLSSAQESEFTMATIGIREAVTALPQWVTDVFDVLHAAYGRREDLYMRMETFIKAFLEVAAAKPQLSDQDKFWYLDCLLEIAEKSGKTEVLRTAIQNIRALRQRENQGENIAQESSIEAAVFAPRCELSELIRQLESVLVILITLHLSKETKSISDMLEMANEEMELLNASASSDPADLVRHLTKKEIADRSDQFIDLLRNALARAKRQEQAPGDAPATEQATA